MSEPIRIGKAKKKKEEPKKKGEANNERPYGFNDIPSKIIEPINFYSTIPKKFITNERHYENEKNINIKLPFRSIIIGAAGSGKTNTAVNIFHSINAFEKIYLYAKDITQPLYAFLIDTLQKVGAAQKPPRELITASTDISAIPPVEDYDKKINNLVIFDDIVLEDKKIQKKIAQYFVRGRNQNISVMYLSQSYFEVPTIIRRNSDYIFVKKITTSNDLKRIIKEYSLDVDPIVLEKIYALIRKEGLEHFLLIDLNANDNKLKYRMDFSPLPPSILKKLGPSSKLGGEVELEEEKKQEVQPDELEVEELKKIKKTKAKKKEPEQKSEVSLEELEEYYNMCSIKEKKEIEAYLKENNIKFL